MLYTRKGDGGTTKVFDSKPGVRISKSSCQTEALGVLDELNSFIGLVKVRVTKLDWLILEKRPEMIIHWIQDCLFTIQAEVAGATKRVASADVAELESFTDDIERELPPIKTFFVSGGTEEAALFDVSRTLARKAERRVIGGIEAGEFYVGPDTLSYLNRLSSLLYAMARFSNYKAGVSEKAPEYR